MNYSVKDNIRTGTETIGDTNRFEEMEGKIDIITPNKANKISISISY